jgi:hypothetical protein
VVAPLQYYWGCLKCELNVFANTVVQIDLRQIVRRFIRPMFKNDSQVYFPFAVAGRAGVVGDHRRSALTKCNSRGAPETGCKR